MPRPSFQRCLLCALIALTAACSDSSDTGASSPRDWSLAELYALQEQTPAADLGVDAVALEDAGQGGLEMLLNPSRVMEPAVNRLAQQVLAMTEGIDAAAELRRLVYTQLDSDSPEYLLLGDTRANTIASLYAREIPEPAGRYRGIDFYRHPVLDLQVAMLPGALLGVGTGATLRQLVDRLLDDPAAGEPLPALDNRPIQLRLTLAGDATEMDPLSLQQATAMTGSFQLEAQALVGTVTFIHERAAAYIERFNALAAGSSTAPLAESGEGRIEIPVALPLQRLADRFAIKQLFQAFDGVSYAERIQVGGNPAWLNFKVGTGPNSIFINFEFADESRRRAFEARELPAGFRLAPLRILEDDEPTYFLVLNIYQSSGGLVEGARAEWSVFVEDPETGAPRFLVVQAAAETISADPVNLLTFGEPVSHTLEDGEVRSYVGEPGADGTENLYFRSAFPWPGAQPVLSGFAREFVAANDFIFWGNAVADRGVFNGTVYARDAELIPLEDLRIEDQSRWAGYIKPEPRHALIYRNPLEIIISPWWNLQADYLDVTPGFRQELIDFSNGFYPMTALGAAERAFLGEEDVVRPAQEGTAGPSLYLHFRIADPQGLATELALPDDTDFAHLPLTDDANAEQFVTLQVYRDEDDVCGWRAQWLGYVGSSQGTGAVRGLRLDSQASRACLDADALLQAGSQVALEQAGSRLQLELANLGSAVSATIDSALATPQKPGLLWLQALDVICARVGICDRRFIDGGTLDTALLQVDPSAAIVERLDTRWSTFIEHEPMAVWVATHPRLRVDNPWYNALPRPAP